MKQTDRGVVTWARYWPICLGVGMIPPNGATSCLSDASPETPLGLACRESLSSWEDLCSAPLSKG
jgi:hypothetical protein